MDDIIASEGEIEETSQDNLDVNILFLQLETFIDPTEINFWNFPRIRSHLRKLSRSILPAIIRCLQWARERQTRSSSPLRA